jgi:hypothetical protein
VSGLNLDDVPGDVIERAKHLLLDGIACGLVGARMSWSERATDAICAAEGVGPGALIGTGRRTTPMAAALLNGSYIQGFEPDDYHPDRTAAELTASLLEPGSARSIERRVLGLEDLNDACALVGLLGPPVAPMFAALRDG